MGDTSEGENGVSHGLRKLGSRFWVTKLKKEASWEYRVRLVNLVPWLKSVRKERTSSGGQRV